MADVDEIRYIRAQTSGAFFAAPAGTTLPTDAATALSNAYKGLGNISVDGVKLKIGEEIIELEDMTGDVIKTIVSKQTVELTIKPLCLTNAEAAKARFGSANVSVSTSSVTGITIKHADLPAMVYVLECIADNGKKVRVVVANGQLAGDSEYNFDPKNPSAGDWTIKCLPNASGVKAIIFFATS